MSKNNKKVVSVLEKEEEYRRINVELEAKTAALVKEADNLLKQTVSKLETPLLDYAVSIEDDNLEVPEQRTEKVIKCQDSFQNDIRSKITEISGNIKNYDSNQTEKVMTGDIPNELNNEDLGYEVQNRYLKAKLRVLQEDNEKLAKELLKKQDDVSTLQGRIKEVEDERNRLHKTNGTQMVQIEKSRKISEDYKSKNEILEAQVVALKKELEQTKRSLEQQNSSTKGQEVRLNRALEEASKYKSQLSQVKTSQKDSSDADKKKVEQLLADSRRLERQKAELIQAFRKQMQLIDVLKRQKMQIEVAKMLQFTEDEFVKALDWDK